MDNRPMADLANVHPSPPPAPATRGFDPVGGGAWVPSGPEQPQDAAFMARALALAALAAERGEVPIGAVLVGADGATLAETHNRTFTDSDPTAHAEILAVREGAKKLGTPRLTGATLYVTLEPCPMCAGAILQARLGRLVYAAPDLRAGAVTTVYDLIARPCLNHRLAWTQGVLSDESILGLKAFFRLRRKRDTLPTINTQGLPPGPA